MTTTIQISIYRQIQASIAVKLSILEDQKIMSQIEALVTTSLDALKSGGKIIFAGNGGSFADAQHLSAELTSRFLFDRRPLPSLVLGANNSSMSAIGNDYGYEQVFARELEGIAKSKDIFIPISTSGNSPNILAAVEVAKRLDIVTTALTGAGGGQLTSMCKNICVPSIDVARIQECHIMIGHIFCGLIEQIYFQGKGDP